MLFLPLTAGAVGGGKLVRKDRDKLPPHSLQRRWDALTVRKTVTQEMEHAGGKSYPITVTRLRSEEPFPFEHQGKTYCVDAVTITDSEKYGISTIFTVHQKFTEEERGTGKKRIEQAIAQVMVQQGLW